MEKEKIEKIVSKHRHEKAALLAIFHDIQKEDKQTGMESLRYIAQLMNVSYAHIYGLATFYGAFSTEKKGDMDIRVCDGLACHINGADEVIETLNSELHMGFDETSWDEKYTLGKVHCLGLCTIGPNASLNGKAHSRLDKEKILKVLQDKKGR